MEQHHPNVMVENRVFPKKNLNTLWGYLVYHIFRAMMMTNHPMTVPHRSGHLPGAYVFSGKTTRVFNRPPRSRGRVLGVNFWFSRILGFLAESGPLAPLVFSCIFHKIEYAIIIRTPLCVLFGGGGKFRSFCNDVI